MTDRIRNLIREVLDEYRTQLSDLHTDREGDWPEIEGHDDRIMAMRWWFAGYQVGYDTSEAGVNG